MLRELQLFTDACAAAGVKKEDVYQYRVTVDSVRIVMKDGKKYVLEIVNLNPPMVADPHAPAGALKRRVRK